jgi:hypothetical protein
MIISVISYGLPAVAVLSGLLWLYGYLQGKEDSTTRLRVRKEQAYPAQAKITGIRRGITGKEIQRLVHLELLVTPLGSNSYPAETIWLVEALYFNKIQEENILPVRIDESNPAIIYPDIPWAVYTEEYRRL